MLIYLVNKTKQTEQNNIYLIYQRGEKCGKIGSSWYNDDKKIHDKVVIVFFICILHTVHIAAKHNKVVLFYLKVKFTL